MYKLKKILEIVLSNLFIFPLALTFEYIFEGFGGLGAVSKLWRVARVPLILIWAIYAIPIKIHNDIDYLINH